MPRLPSCKPRSARLSSVVSSRNELCACAVPASGAASGLAAGLRAALGASLGSSSGTTAGAATGSATCAGSAMVALGASCRCTRR
jgi:hypothetical protein